MIISKNGHLLLSAGLDGTCHIYSTTPTTNDRNNHINHTYHRHSAAVEDIEYQLSCCFLQYNIS